MIPVSLVSPVSQVSLVCLWCPSDFGVPVSLVSPVSFGVLGVSGVFGIPVVSL